jgi:hypothetical protein
MSDALRGIDGCSEYKLGLKDVLGRVYECILSHFASTEGSGSCTGCPRPTVVGVCRASDALYPTITSRSPRYSPA